MSAHDFREALAEAIDRADDQWQHGIGAGGYDPAGPPLWLADAVLALLAERLGGDEVRDVVCAALCGGRWDGYCLPDAEEDRATAALAALRGCLGVQR